MTNSEDDEDDAGVEEEGCCVEGCEVGDFSGGVGFGVHCCGSWDPILRDLGVGLCIRGGER